MTAQTETTTVELQLGPSADLEITKSPEPVTANAGEQVTYTFTVTNYGPQIATNVRVQDIIPFGVRVINNDDITPSNPDYPDAYCTPSGTCYLGTMNVDTVATIEMIVLVDSSYMDLPLVNTAYVTADQADADPSNNITDASIIISWDANLEITKLDMVDPVIAGENILYEITVTNNGPSDAQDVVISDYVPEVPGFPDALTFSNASPICSLGFGDEITCEIGSLAANETKSVFIQLKTNEELENGTPVDNTARVSSSSTTEVPEATQTTTVNQSIFGVHRS